ncbi:unnamed protein product [Adineta steineri]|uniref:Uncharacterized protein n=1 Tax=Adineta steineri TaxID=433720 RepID=A0A815F777_9BILA|nr:unnamed protein product [Adineta steineri]CAF1331913.1 unnamed protein product [Adineta steineri]
MNNNDNNINTYAGPASSRSQWKVTQDPGKTSPTSNAAGYRSAGLDVNPASLTASNLPQEQQSEAEEKKQ